MIDYLQGKLSKATNLKRYAAKRAGWRTLMDRRKVRGQYRGELQTFEPLSSALSVPAVDALARLIQHQRLERIAEAWGHDPEWLVNQIGSEGRGVSR